MPYAPDSYPRQIPQFKIHGRGEVTVSAKGIVTGDSDIPNNGADFGPDTTLKASEPNQYGGIYTQTCGIQEAINYAYPLGLQVTLIGHIFPIIAPYTVGIHRNYCIELPSNSTISAPTSLKIVGKWGGGALNTILPGVPEGAYSGDMSSVIIDASSVLPITTTNQSWIFGNDNSGSGYPSLVLIMENIAVIAPSSGNSNLNSSGIHAGYPVCGAALLRNVSVSKPFSSNNSNNNGIGIKITGGVTDNSWSDMLNVAGFGVGLEINLQWTVIGSINITACSIGIQFYNYGGNQDNLLTILFLNFTLCQYPLSPSLTTGGYSVLFNIFSMAIYYDSSNNSYPLSDDTNDPSNYLNGTIYSYIKQDGATSSYESPSLNTSSNIHIEYVASNNGQFIKFQPPVTITVNPPVSGTVYQNTNAHNIEIDLPVYATTSGTAGYVTIAKGSSSSPTAIGNQYVNGATSSTSTDIIKLRVPAGWYYSFTASGVTFGTASVFAD